MCGGGAAAQRERWWWWWCKAVRMQTHAKATGSRGRGCLRGGSAAAATAAQRGAGRGQWCGAACARAPASTARVRALHRAAPHAPRLPGLRRHVQKAMHAVPLLPARPPPGSMPCGYRRILPDPPPCLPKAAPRGADLEHARDVAQVHHVEGVLHLVVRDVLHGLGLHAGRAACGEGRRGTAVAGQRTGQGRERARRNASPGITQSEALAKRTAGACAKGHRLPGARCLPNHMPRPPPPTPVTTTHRS